MTVEAESWWRLRLSCERPASCALGRVCKEEIRLVLQRLGYTPLRAAALLRSSHHRSTVRLGHVASGCLSELR